MQLEQQERFEVTGPQLEVLGEVESRLPAPARRRPFAVAAVAVAMAVAVFGIGGARLKGAHDAVLRQFTETNEYGQGIVNDLAIQADAAASLIRVGAAVLGEDHAEVAAARQALEGWNALPDDAMPDAQSAANRQLYGAVDGLYNLALPRADGDELERLQELHATYVSAQATIDRAAAQYNDAARAYNDTARAFPAALLGALWGAGELPAFGG